MRAPRASGTLDATMTITVHDASHNPVSGLRSREHGAARHWRKLVRDYRERPMSGIEADAKELGQRDVQRDEPQRGDLQLGR